MSTDDFENQLRRQPLRSIPAHWRAEILRTAASAQEKSHPPVVAPWWRQVFWPSPLAWGGVAALWVATVILHLSTPVTLTVARHSAPATPVSMALVEQRAWLEQLLQAPPTATAQEPALLRPRSQRAGRMETC